MLVAVVVLIGLALANAGALLGDRFGAVAAMVLAVVWLPVNQPVEGNVLVVLSSENGITQADLISVVSMLIGAGSLAWGLAADWKASHRR